MSEKVPRGEMMEFMDAEDEEEEKDRDFRWFNVRGFLVGGRNVYDGPQVLQITIKPHRGVTWVSASLRYEVNVHWKAFPFVFPTFKVMDSWQRFLFSETNLCDTELLWLDFFVDVPLAFRCIRDSIGFIGREDIYDNDEYRDWCIRFGTRRGRNLSEWYDKVLEVEERRKKDAEKRKRMSTATAGLPQVQAEEAFDNWVLSMDDLCRMSRRVSGNALGKMLRIDESSTNGNLRELISSTVSLFQKFPKAEILEEAVGTPAELRILRKVIEVEGMYRVYRDLGKVGREKVLREDPQFAAKLDRVNKLDLVNFFSPR